MSLNDRIPELARAVDAAIAAGQLPARAARWRTVVLLEELASVLALPRTALRNMYYRNPLRLAAELDAYALSNPAGLDERIRHHAAQGRHPIVWKRPLGETITSYDSLNGAIAVAETADTVLRRDPMPRPSFRREVGGLAVEIMAAALSFYNGQKRWRLLQRAERVFLNAMSPLSLEVEVSPIDAALFARFWENRATVCALEWSTIWDDPNIGAPVATPVIELAISELRSAVKWENKARPDSNRPVSAGRQARLAQLTSDQANWLIKIGQFEQAESVLDKVAVDFGRSAAGRRLLHVRCLANLQNHAYAKALRLANGLAELEAHLSGHGSHGHASALMLVHHIHLLEGKTPEVPYVVEKFLRQSPVAVSDLVNFERYVKRLSALEYTVVGQKTSEPPIN
jgi:hypothetical protein